MMCYVLYVNDNNKIVMDHGDDDERTHNHNNIKAKRGTSLAHFLSASGESAVHYSKFLCFNQSCTVLRSPTFLLLLQLICIQLLYTGNYHYDGSSISRHSMFMALEPPTSP